MTECCPAREIDELYRDLEIKAAIDVDATVKLIEALEPVLAGVSTGGQLPAIPTLPGKAPAELARQAARLRGVLGPALNAGKIINLRDSLYRYQSL